MTSPKRAYIDGNGDRLYVNLDVTRRNLAVSSALGVLDKPWLPKWYAKIVAENAAELLGIWFYDDDMPVALLPYYDDHSEDIDFELLADDLAASPEWERDEAGGLGDEVHSAAERILVASRGNPEAASALLWMESEGYDGLSGECASRLDGMMDWLRDNKVEVLMTEFTVFNDTHNYAGSCDILARVNGELMFIDVKTSKNWDDKFPLQIAAYANGEYGVDDKDNRFELPEGVHDAGGAVLWLKDGKAEYWVVNIGDEIYDGFLACLLLKRIWLDITARSQREKKWTNKKGKKNE
jgi:hypothetical protein